MTPEALHRSHMTALIAGDLNQAADLRRRFGPRDTTTAANLLRATVAVCLESRLGPGAGLGAGPINFDELAAFMRQIRATGFGVEPPLDFLAVEAVVRSLYGEDHLTEPLSAQAKSTALYTVMRHQVRAHRWLGANPGIVIDRAQAVMTTWLLG